MGSTKSRCREIKARKAESQKMRRERRQQKRKRRDGGGSQRGHVGGSEEGSGVAKAMKTSVDAIALGHPGQAEQSAVDQLALFDLSVMGLPVVADPFRDVERVPNVRAVPTLRELALAAIPNISTPALAVQEEILSPTLDLQLESRNVVTTSSEVAENMIQPVPVPPAKESVMQCIPPIGRLTARIVRMCRGEAQVAMAGQDLLLDELIADIKRQEIADETTVSLALQILYRLKTAEMELGLAGSAGPRMEFAVCVLLANKALFDRSYRNKFMTTELGFDLKEFTTLERTILSRICFDIGMSVGDFNGWNQSLFSAAEDIRCGEIPEIFAEFVKERTALSGGETVGSKPELATEENQVQGSTIAIMDMEASCDESESVVGTVNQTANVLNWLNEVQGESANDDLRRALSSLSGRLEATENRPWQIRKDSLGSIASSAAAGNGAGPGIKDCFGLSPIQSDDTSSSPPGASIWGSPKEDAPIQETPISARFDQQPEAEFLSSVDQGQIQHQRWVECEPLSGLLAIEHNPKFDFAPMPHPLIARPPPFQFLHEHAHTFLPHASGTTWQNQTVLPPGLIDYLYSSFIQHTQTSRVPAMPFTGHRFFPRMPAQQWADGMGRHHIHPSLLPVQPPQQLIPEPVLVEERPLSVGRLLPLPYLRALQL
ncbi:hypothetical protein HDU97_002409 [Phlyctochytrium planicorne]|nr:hypothetical protein HDU97_002409 [Phlyctochytrium planicorne]